jgi:hypothetical protein
MQMGRWFGYRPGYVDLCRLYTTNQLVTWYRHVTMATEEMRDDFDLMARENKRPKDYQLKVRTSPGMLAITSAGRMKEVETIRLAYSGALRQTYDFSPNQSDADLNYRAFTRLLGKLKSPEADRNLLFRGVDVNNVCDFVSECVSFDYLRPDAIVGYIRKQNEQHRLTEWNVAVILSTSKKQRAEGIDGEDSINHEFIWNDGNCEGFLPGRHLKFEGGRLVVPNSKNAILDKSARIVDLGLKTSDKEEDIKKKRRELGIPLLVIMPLDPRISRTFKNDVPLIGYGIQFPEIEGEVRYEYAARPLRPEFDEEPQQSDDPADKEDES